MQRDVRRRPRKSAQWKLALVALFALAVLGGATITLRWNLGTVPRGSVGSPPGRSVNPLHTGTGSTSHDSGDAGIEAEARGLPSVVPDSGAWRVLQRRPEVDERKAEKERKAMLTWHRRALCNGAATDKLAAWSWYLRGFRRMEAPEVELYADPTVSPLVAERVGRSVAGEVRDFVVRGTGLDAEPPAVYLHATAEAMRRYACVNDAAVAFYDGAIHLVDLSGQRGGGLEMLRSLLHEYTHHVLMQHGIDEPIWFQEGLAMHVAEGPWKNFHVTPPGIDLPEMVDGFPHTAPADYARRFYAQAYVMLSFLHELCHGSYLCRDAAMVQALTDGSTSPEELFEWTIEHLEPRANQPAWELWQSYLDRPEPEH
jgi:hypothetical protein